MEGWEYIMAFKFNIGDKYVDIQYIKNLFNSNTVNKFFELEKHGSLIRTVRCIDNDFINQVNQHQYLHLEKDKETILKLIKDYYNQMVGKENDYFELKIKQHNNILAQLKEDLNNGLALINNKNYETIDDYMMIHNSQITNVNDFAKIFQEMIGNALVDYSTTRGDDH